MTWFSVNSLLREVSTPIIGTHYLSHTNLTTQMMPTMPQSFTNLLLLIKLSQHLLGHRHLLVPLMLLMLLSIPGFSIPLTAANRDSLEINHRMLPYRIVITATSFSIR